MVYRVYAGVDVSIHALVRVRLKSIMQFLPNIQFQSTHS